MKGVISIFLTVLLLMNTLGYYGIFFGLQYQNSARMVKAFDEGTYDESKEIVLKFPIAIPYNSNSSFQRVDGIFEYEHEFYRLIKQRIVSDTLEVVLINDDRHRTIHEDITKHTERNDSSKSTIDFIKDYLPQTTDIIRASEGWQCILNRETVIVKHPVLYHRSESPPPKQV